MPTPAQGGEAANPEQGAQGAAEDNGQEQGVSLNTQAKQLPWVRDALAAQAELARLKQEQDEAAARAEREKAESEGRYQDALKAIEEERKKEQEKYRTELTQLKLETAFAQEGVVDPRVVALFAPEYDGETPATEFVKAVKSQEANAVFFTKPRPPHSPPTPPAGGPPDDFDPERDLQSWKRSSDPVKRKRAFDFERERYAKKLKEAMRDGI